MKWSTIERFRKPLEFFVPKLVAGYDEAEHNKKVEGAFKRVFNTVDGEIVLRYLIEDVGLDAQMGAQSEDSMLYLSAKQDLVKQMLSLVN